MAIGYAPRALRPAWTGLLALDRRLADAAREGREPIMIQLRLAWWRDRLSEPAAQWPQGEPLLAALAAWDAHRAALIGLVDGHEARVVGEDGGAALDAARVSALIALAGMAGESLADPAQSAVAAWARGEALPPVRLPRALRPLLVLDHFARNEGAAPWRLLTGAIRKALIGR